MNGSGGSTLLVTGAPGWLTDAFLRSIARDPLPGFSRVRCLVHASHPFEPGERIGRWGMDAEIVRCRLEDEPLLAEATRGVDAIVHSAAVLHPRTIEEYYSVNALGTRNLARAAAGAGVRRFVYVSTNAAAGRAEPGAPPIREADPDKPLSHYGRSKWLGERWLADTPGPMEKTVLRPCMFYGPPVPTRHVEIYRRLVSGWMPLVGGGGYVRSLTYIDNLVWALRLALTKPAGPWQVYNIADREPYTTKQVVDAMARALGVKPRYVPLPAFASDVAFRLDTFLSMLGYYQQTVHLGGEATWNVGVSIDKARGELGYEPQVSLEEGMRAAVEWCRAQKQL
jgi:nucleoside-diphosphate-sugar epimerase